MVLTCKIKEILFLLILRGIISAQEVQGKACEKYRNTLDSCDSSAVSENIYIDFGEIKYECKCSISPNFSGHMYLYLETYPDHEDCGTAVRIRLDSYNHKYRLSCGTSQPTFFLTNRSTTVELIQTNDFPGPTSYCLRVYTHDISSIIKASCGRSKTTSREANSSIITNRGRNRPSSQEITQTTMNVRQLLTAEDIRYTSNRYKSNTTAAYVSADSYDNVLLIGLAICGILVFVLTGISLYLVIYTLNSRNRKSTPKNNENETEIPESTLTSPWDRPNSAYTTLNVREATDPVEQPYTRLNVIIGHEAQAAFSTRPDSTYTSINPEHDNYNTGQL